jgi:hypothetical protein
MKNVYTIFLVTYFAAVFLVPVSVVEARMFGMAASAGSATASPGASVAVTVSLSIDTNNATDTWKSVGYLIAKSDSGPYTCVNIPPHAGVGAYTEQVTAMAPATAGKYNVYITYHAGADCFNPYVALVPPLLNALTVIAPVSVAVSSVSVVNKVYDGSSAAGATTVCTLVGSPAGVTCSGTGLFVDTNVGTNKVVAVTGITLSGPNASLYSLANTTASTEANITHTLLTVTAANATRVYGSANPTFTSSLSGFVAGESAASAHVAGSAVCTTAATSTTSVGTAPITCTAGTLAADNYAFASFVPGTLTITKAPQSITFPVLASATYGTSRSLSALASSSLAVSYESRTPLVCTVSGTDVMPLGVGACTIRATQSGDDNYTAAPHVEQTFSVAPALTTTTVSCPLTVVYSGSAQTPCTANVSGSNFVQSVPVEYSPNVHAGIATASASFVGTDLYEPSTGSVSFTITKKEIRIVPTSGQSKLITKTDPLFVYTIEPSLYTGDSITGVLARASGESAGEHVFTLGTLSAGGDYRLMLDAPTAFAILPDITAPAIALHTDVVAEAISADGAVGTYTLPIASDGVDVQVDVACLPSSGSTFVLGTTTVTCSARDAGGNSASSSFTITVRDTTAPVVTLAGASTHTLVTPAEYTEQGATWADAVDGTGDAAASGTVDSSTPGTYTRTYTYTDRAGNTGTATRAVTVNDGEAPVFTNIPATISAEATSSAGSEVVYTPPTATDAVDGAVDVLCVPASGSVFPLGSTVVACNATDASVHAARATFIVRVLDTAPPTLSVVGAATRELFVGDTYIEEGALWTDVVDGTGVAEISSDTVDTARAGTYVVVYTARDAAGNSADQKTRIVTVAKKSQRITYTQPVEKTNADADFAVDVTSSAELAVSLATSTPDTCTVAGRTVHIVRVGTCTLEASAPASAHYLVAESVQITFTVRDAVPPQMEAHVGVRVEADTREGSIVTYTTPPALDETDGEVRVACLPASGTRFPLGATSVSCAARDASGNSEQSAFIVRVVDTAPPVTTLVGSDMVTITMPEQYEERGALWADAVDGAGSTNVLGEVRATTPGTYILSYTYTDAAGNAATPMTRTVHVVAAAPPPDLPPAASGGGAIAGTVVTFFTAPATNTKQSAPAASDLARAPTAPAPTVPTVPTFLPVTPTPASVPTIQPTPATPRVLGVTTERVPQPAQTEALAEVPPPPLEAIPQPELLTPDSVPLALTQSATVADSGILTNLFESPLLLILITLVAFAISGVTGTALYRAFTDSNA